jgi:asparagine synthase (glutamine-hydrolysing)
MWAFAIWDQKKKKLFLSRDNFGEKPLYYTFENNAFYFGSEIKFIKSLSEIKFRLNKNKIYKYLSFGYKSINNDNNTFYKNVHLLENATNITVDLNLKFIKKKYWRPKLKINNSIDAETAASHTRFLVKKSLDFRMRSDVPIAFCLSGGIDSGFLYSAASIKQDNIKSFSIIDSDKRYNESENINLLLNKNKAQNIKINIKNKNKNFFNMVNYITKYQDAPISTISYYVHSLLCKEINKNNYRIAISGTGADELFTGYYDHFLLQLATINKTHMYKKKLNDWKSFIKPIIRNKFLKKYD